MNRIATSSAESSESPSLVELFRPIFRIGITTFGSGFTAVTLIGDAFVHRGWVSAAQRDLCFTMARAAPGTNVFSFVAAICWIARGWKGAAAGVLALSIPAAFVVVLLTMAYQMGKDHPLGKQAIAGILAAIAGIMLAGAWLIVGPRPKTVRTAILIAFALVAYRWLSPISIMGIAAAAGYFWVEDEGS